MVELRPKEVELSERLVAVETEVRVGFKEIHRRLDNLSSITERLGRVYPPPAGGMNGHSQTKEQLQYGGIGAAIASALLLIASRLTEVI